MKSILIIISIFSLVGVYFLFGYLVGKIVGRSETLKEVKKIIKEVKKKEIDKSIKENIPADQDLPGYSDWAKK